MKIKKFIVISQEVEIDLVVEDLILIFDDEIDPEKQDHILNQISCGWQFFNALPDKFIDSLNDKQKKTIYTAFQEITERFKPVL